MPSTSSEYKVEQVIIELIKITLTGVSVLHFDEDTDANQQRIVVQAVRGNLQKEGPGCYEYTVTISAKGLTGSSTTWDDWRNIIEASLLAPPGSPSAGYTAAIALFTVFMEPPELNESAERDQAENIRTGSLIYEFICKLA